MGRITSFWATLKSLGVFGFILVAIIAIVTWSWLNTIRLGLPQELVDEQVRKLDHLENTILFYLLEQEIRQDHFVLSDGDQTHIDAHAQAGGQIDQSLAWFQKWEVLLRPDEVNAVEELVHLQKDYKLTFDQLVDALMAGDADQVGQLQELAAIQMDQMHEQVTVLIHISQDMLLAASEQASQQAQQSIMGSVIGLVLLPLLAIWAFLVASGVTRPVLTLTNAVTTIEGDHYRAELLADGIDRRDRLGELARAVDEMASAVQDREKVLKNEIEALREELAQVRRRKRLSQTSGVVEDYQGRAGQ
jgi:methyl-accepting chemotaxis protein